MLSRITVSPRIPVPMYSLKLITSIFKRAFMPLSARAREDVSSGGPGLRPLSRLLFRFSLPGWLFTYIVQFRTCKLIHREPGISHTVEKDLAFEFFSTVFFCWVHGQKEFLACPHLLPLVSKKNFRWWTAIQASFVPHILSVLEKGAPLLWRTNQARNAAIGGGNCHRYLPGYCRSPAPELTRTYDRRWLDLLAPDDGYADQRRARILARAGKTRSPCRTSAMSDSGRRITGYCALDPDFWSACTCRAWKSRKMASS